MYFIWISCSCLLHLQRLQAEFFEHLRAEYKLHYATFYDETNAWTIRHTISHGLVAFCQFYLRICNVYFSPVSVVDIFTGASMVCVQLWCVICRSRLHFLSPVMLLQYNHIWKVAGKAREVVHRLVRAWRNQQVSISILCLLTPCLLLTRGSFVAATWVKPAVYHPRNC